MRKLEVAVPWNNPSYLPCNGFHPLYQALFDDQGQGDVNFNIIDEILFAERLNNKNYFNDILNEVDRFQTDLKSKWSRYPIAEKFLTYVSVEDLWLASSIPGDIEFHHTSPLTSGGRPFVFHCESFLPIFMPFAYQGAGGIKNPEQVKKFYGALFEDDSCLNIYSHLPATLDQISNFFRNSKIDKKLIQTRTGLSNSVFSQLSMPLHETDEQPRFLFTSSAHQQSNAFRLRGGYAVLLFALRYLNQNRPGLFIFRCAKPIDSDLEKYGVNLQSLSEAEDRQQVLWIEGFLPDKEQLALFRHADFFLLPSVNLHSVSIMQSQLAGAVAIVTDTFGTEKFVTDGETGIVLSGVRKALWHLDQSTGVLCDDHSLWSKELAEHLALELFQRVAQLLHSRIDLASMRRQIKEYARKEYAGEQFRREFFQTLPNAESIVPIRSENLHATNVTPPIFCDSTENVLSLFSSPPQPSKVLTLEQAAVFHLKGVYWFFAKHLDLRAIATWGPLFWAKRGLLGTNDVAFASRIEYLGERLLPVTHGFSASFIYYVETKVRWLALRYPLVHGWLEKIAPILKEFLYIIEMSLVLQDESISEAKSGFKGLLLKVPYLKGMLVKLYFSYQFIRRYPIIREVIAGIIFFVRMMSVFSRLLLVFFTYCFRLALSKILK